MSIAFDEAPDSERAVREMESFLRENRAWLAELGKQPVRMEFSIGLLVGAKDSFVPSLELPSGLLALLSGLGIHVEVVGYPAT